MPSVEQIAQLCTLVGHLNQFNLTEGRMHGINDTAESRVVSKTVTHEDSDLITNMITCIIGFVHWDSDIEGEYFRKALHESEQRLVQRIEALQREFSQVEAISVTVTPEEPPMSWILRLLQPRYAMMDKSGYASQD